MQPTSLFWWRCLRFLKTLYDRFFSDGCMYRAAALTYTSLLSLVPLMTVGLAIFSAFPVFSRLSGEVQNFVFSHFVATSGELVQSYLQRFVSQTANLSIIGLIFLIITAILMMFNMEQAFNAIWHVRQRRYGVVTFMIYWAVLTLSPLLIGLSIVVSAYVATLPMITTATQTLGLQKPLIAILPFLLSTATFTLLYVAVPNCHVPFRFALMGALVSAALFESAKTGFTYYVSHFPTYTLLYGALATIPLFLVWLYLSWLIVLFGALLSNLLAMGYQYRSGVKLDGFTQAYRWLGHLWLRQKEGKGLSLQELVALDTVNYEVYPEQQIDLMLRTNLIQPIANGKYVLSKDLASLSLEDLRVLLPWRLPTPTQLAQFPGAWEQNLYSVIKKIEHKATEELNVRVVSLFEQD